jgi:pre-mRNA-splicing factor 38A
MANVTDPVIRSLQGSDPQNLMEYITRQKIYDSRFWKEECFGLTATDVIERAAKSLSCVGGTFGGVGRPTKFLSLTLKLLQLQPSIDIVQAFIEQNDFKYLKALGCFYLRLTGRPQEIYEMLEPFYADYSKLKYRDVNEWKLIHMDEFIDELLTKQFCCGIAMPRLPARETLQDAGYLEEGQRSTALNDKLIEAGGIKEYLKVKVDREIQEQIGGTTIGNTSTVIDCFDSAVILWEKRYGKIKIPKRNDLHGSINSNTPTSNTTGSSNEQIIDPDLNTCTDTTNNDDDDLKKDLHTKTTNETAKRKAVDNVDDNIEEKKRKKKKKDKKNNKYGTLFKSDKSKDTVKNSNVDDGSHETKTTKPNNDPESDEYWNSLRSKLGMNPLKK